MENRELPFSKRKQLQNNTIDFQEFKSIKNNESNLQNQCEELLNWKHIFYIRVPDAVYLWIFSIPIVPQYIKGIVSKYLKGLPDLTILFPGGTYWCVELKTKTGKLSQGQKAFAKRVPVTVIRSFEDFEKQLNQRERWQ